ncbi:OsmC family protein [Nocardia brasiliensis]|uniref:OsmC family protein n=1 Tax=Nocardia brasiliensis TaxID=37326 RepID=UPI002458DA1A|nr:OsmC family protein [Nocardia brasiliensis]
MTKAHEYALDVTWTGNTGTGTSGYRDFERSHIVSAEGKPPIPGTADPAFRGAPEHWNPEELLVASLSQCHMLWYLVLCARAGIVVTEYTDHPSGTMVEDPAGGGRFSEVVLRPQARITDAQHRDRALALHERAHDLCFIANSVNFDVRCEPQVAGA